MVVWTHLSTEQRDLYTDFVTSKNSIVTEILRGNCNSPLEGITWLKKLCGHPLLTKKHAPGTDLRDVLLEKDVEELLDQSPKLALVSDLVRHFSSNGHKTLIFSQSTKMLDIIETVLYDSNTLRIDGGVKERDRQEHVDNFNKETSAYDAMLISTKAGGLGLTLTGADRVIGKLARVNAFYLINVPVPNLTPVHLLCSVFSLLVYDPSWTPAEDEQAVDRAYRIGQEREVLVYRLIASGTVEEKMYEKQIHKEGLKRAVLTEQGGTNVDRYFNKHELTQLFTLGEVGSCDLMTKFQKEGRAIVQDPRKHEFVTFHESVVGLSRHDGIYDDDASSASDPSSSSVSSKTPSAKTPTPFGGTRSSAAATTGDAAAKALGRAQLVLVKENANVVPLGRGVGWAADDVSTPRKIRGRSSGPNEATRTSPGGGGLDVSVETIGTPPADAATDAYAAARKENSAPPSSFDGALSAAASLRANGMPRKSLQLLLNVLDRRYGDCNDDDSLSGEQKMLLHAQIASVSEELGLL